MSRAEAEQYLAELTEDKDNFFTTTAVVGEKRVHGQVHLENYYTINPGMTDRAENMLTIEFRDLDTRQTGKFKILDIQEDTANTLNTRVEKLANAFFQQIIESKVYWDHQERVKGMSLGLPEELWETGAQNRAS